MGCKRDQALTQNGVELDGKGIVSELLRERRMKKGGEKDEKRRKR